MHIYVQPLKINYICINCYIKELVILKYIQEFFKNRYQLTKRHEIIHKILI